MVQDVFTFVLDSGQLPDCRDEILELTGYSPQNCDLHISETLDHLLKESDHHMHIRCGYRRFEPSEVTISKNTIRCQNTVFQCGSTISGQLNGSSNLVIFAVTLGSAFDDWSRNLFSGGDPFAGYFADIIGSVRTEQATDWLEQQITKIIASEKLQASNCFSPGYCGWDVAEQHILFSLLPEDFLNIHLSESALMTPIKSVSGIIGIGADIKKEPYTCKFCDMTNCFMRRTKAQKQKKEFA